VQGGTAVGLYAIGRYVLPRAQGEPRTNKVSHLGFDLIRAGLVSQAMTQGIKIAVRRDRPTGQCCAFPSGHSATTFATASVIERHFGYRGALPTYAIAAYVAASRLHDNRHFVSDVLFGAAVGIVSGWTVVGRHGRSDYTLMPVPIRGGVAMIVTRNASSRQAFPGR
jgi:membrane-associated phospholipid phosphatase